MMRTMPVSPVDKSVDTWGNLTPRVGLRGEPSRSVSEACGKVWTTVPKPSGVASRVDAGFSTIHSPYYYEDREFS
jgi:hypothetical protein